jgi:CheY-like chemotaxis protein
VRAAILVIEDDPPTAHLLQILLEREGYQALIASNGVEGLEIAWSRPVDLILLDLMLPGMDGFEGLNRLRSDPRTVSVPIAILSVKSQHTDKQAAARLGADAYLVKPYNHADLLATVDALLRARAMEAEKRGACVTVAGSYREETARVVLYTGLVLTGKGEAPIVVDLYPRSTLYSSLLGLPPVHLRSRWPIRRRCAYRPDWLSRIIVACGCSTRWKGERKRAILPTRTCSRCWMHC